MQTWTWASVALLAAAGGLASRGAAPAGKADVFTVEEFDLNVETTYIEYKGSQSLAETTFNSMILTVEILTKLFNMSFVKVDDSWVPDNKTGWEHVEAGLTIYKDLRLQIFEYMQHRDEILRMLRELKDSLHDKDVLLDYFVTFGDDFKLLTQAEVEEEKDPEKMQLTKAKILAFYSLEKIHLYLHSLTLSKSERFKEMEKYIEYEIVDYVNSLNLFIFNIYFIIAQDEIFWAKSLFIRETLDDRNYLALFLHSADAVVDLVSLYVKYKHDWERFYRNITSILARILLKGERFSQILTDQIVYVRLSAVNREHLPQSTE